MKKLLLTGFIILVGCTKVVQPIPQVIDLGTKATSTAIKHISQVGNIVTAEFQTDPLPNYGSQGPSNLSRITPAGETEWPAITRPYASVALFA